MNNKGKVRDNVEVKQKETRNALELFEFWKKDSEFFPKEIFESDENVGINTLPHAVVFVFRGSAKDVIGEEDVAFYKEMIDFCSRRGYYNIQVVLTMIDEFERKVKEENKTLVVI